MEDNKRKLYDALSDEFDLGTYEEFERNIGDSNKRRKLFDAASADYDLGDFESYSQKIGPTHKESLDIFNAENGAFMDDFEARDTAEAKISRAGMSSGLYVPTEGSITGEERQRYMELRQREDALKKAWYTSDEYLEQKDADAFQLAKMRDSIDRGRMAYAQENPVIEGYNPSATRGADADKEMQMYETASRIMTDAIKMHNAPGKYDGENVFLKFGKGAGDKASDIDFWTMGLSEIADNLGVREVLSSVQNKLGNLNDLSEEAIENILSPAEKAALQAWAINAQEQLKRRDDLSRAYQGGQGAVESLGFMAEFALTGGVGKLASEGAETMARWLGKKALTTIGGKADDVAEQIIKETGERIAENTVGKYAAGLGRSLAEAAGRTGVMPSTFRNITEKATEIHTDEEGNNYLVGMNNAFAKGFADSFIENLSEGGRVNALGELIGDVAGKIPAYRRMVDKFSNTKASELLDAFNSSGIMNTLRAGGWHGFGEEYLEEWYGNALRTLTGVDKEALKEFATVDNQIVTITSFLPMTIFGGTVSTAQVLSSKRDLDKKAEALRSALLERGYDEAQANNMIDMMRGSTPAEVSEFLSPIVNAVAGRSVDEAAALMKPVGEFAEAVRRWQAFDTKYKYQEQEQRDDLRSQMESTIGQFWQEDENGRQTVQRGVNAKGEAVYMLGKPSAEEAEAGVASEVAAVTSDGRKVFVNPSDYELEDELEMNDFLGTEIMAEKRNKEQARMIEEKEAQIAAIREAAVPGIAVNIGTAEAPVQAIVIQRNPNGVIVNTPDGQTRQMTYEEFGNYVGINAVPLTDAQIDEQEADALSAERSQREAALDQEYNNEDAAIEELTEAENEIEQVETTTPLPTRADGSVDQTALWNNDPARWAQWNDEQRQDGGANSLAYINGAIARGEAAVAELTAAYNAEPDFDRRASMEQQIAANAERLQGLVNLRDGYVAQAEAAQVAAEEVAAEQVAPRITSQMSEEEKAQMDAQHQARLDAAKSITAKREAMQNYINELSQGSVPMTLISMDEYEQVMKDAGCTPNQIAQVKAAIRGAKRRGQSIPAFFVPRVGIFAFVENIPNIEQLRLTYVHERQHQFTASDKKYLDALLQLGLSRERMSEIVYRLSGSDFYKDDPARVLADEIISYAMERAYTYEDFSVALQELGIEQEIIDIITEIDNEQRNEDATYSSRRRGRYDLHDDSGRQGDRTENDRNQEPVSSGLLDEQRDRPLDDGLGRARSTGEGAESGEVISDDEEAEVPTAEEVLTEAGFEIDEQNEDARFSVRYLPTPDQREGIIDSIIAVTGRTRDDAERWLESELSLAAIVLNDKEYLDYAPDSKYKAIKDNSDYPQGTVDFNNICRKRKDFTRMYTRLQRAYPNRIFTAEDLADIRTIMSEDGLVVACGLCYVEDRRQKLGEVADEFIKDLQDGFKSYGKKNATKRANAEKFRSFVGADTYVPSIYDLITLEGSDKLHDEHKGIWDAFGAYNRARGQQTQNTFQGYAEYKREILTWSDAKVKKVNSLGGLRIFSYSDFEAHHLLDIIQIIIDCSARGVMIQGYTKVPEFARVVEKTGIKLNRSLIPLGDTGIVDGKLAYDPVEGIDINDPNFLESNDNVGNILIGINDEQIRMAMADPFIHYIIPYHARQAGNIRAKLNVGAWTNYIDTQNERKKSDGKRVEKNINIYTDVLNESITNDREFVEKYLEVCREKGYIPKFDQFLDRDTEGNYVYTPGYYKFLVDFKLFDEAGNILPQKPVVAQFDDAFNAQVLLDYAREERETAGEAMNSTYDKIVETLDLGEPTVGEDVGFSESEGPIDLVEEAKKAQAKHDAKESDVRFRVLDTTNAELKEKPIKLNGMYRFKLKNAFKGVKDNGGSYPYIKVQLVEVSDDYSGKKIAYNGILEGFAVVRIPKGLITEGEKDNEFFIDPKAIENELWDVLRATENYYEFKHGGAPYQRDWLNADEVRFRVRTEGEREKLFEDAKKEFGLTNNFNVAGYMLPDGSLLNFGDPANPTTRAEDHRAIEGVIMENGTEYENRWEYLADFMNEGAIRLLPEYAGINLMKAPTKEQRQRLMDFIYKYNGEVILEIADERLNNVAYVEYDRKTAPARIFRDIDGYFNDGIIPQQDIRFRVTEDGKPIFNLQSRINVPKVRGGWTEAKILRYLKQHGSREGVRAASMAIAQFDSVEELKEHMFYHGSQGGAGVLKPSITMSDREIERIGGGGYGDKYWGISVSKSKEIASRFSSGSSVRIYPIILLKDAKVIERPDFSDAWDAGEHIVELWNEGVDAVWIGNGKQGGGEQELLVLNPRAIVNINTADFYRYYKLGSAENPLRIADDEAIEKMYATAKEYASTYQPRKPIRPMKPWAPSRIDDNFNRKSEEQYQSEVEEYNRALEQYERDMQVYEDALKVYNESDEKKAFDVLEAKARQDIRFRMSNNNQAIFVSNAARAVEGIKQEKATPEQWLKMLEKAGGLKAGEDKWMGLSDWLKASDKKTLTKAEVLEFIGEHMIVIEEQHYSDEEVAASANKELNDKYPGWEDAFSMEWDTYMDEPYASIWDNETAVELYNDTHEEHIELDEDGEFENLDDESKVMDFGKELAEIYYRGNTDVRPIHGTRSDYQTRGLSDNHEIALTVPTIESWRPGDAVHFGDAGDGRAIAWIRFGETKYRPDGIADEVAALDKAILEYEGETSDDEYKALVEKKHALLRASRAQKVLVIDEIQSQRHQEGRDKGYRSPASKRLLEEANALSKQLAEFEYELRAKYKIKGAYSTYELMPAVERKGSKEDYERYIALNNERNAKYAEYEKSIEGVDRNAPFDAPFDKNWHELAMKRMLRYAAENGYDVIAWTTGDQQASRYDLSKMVKKISVYPSKDGSRNVNLYLVDRENDFKNLVVDSEGMVTFGEYKGRALADVVGKDYSMKIMAATRNTEFSGDNLQVGGEGMRGFYGKMLPAFMNKYGKRWGVKVEDINLPNLGKYGYTMHSIPVTEEMKASVMEGQVMFRMRGENESIQEFFESAVSDYKAKYTELGTLMALPVDDITAMRFGFTLEQLQKINGLYESGTDIIAIFAHKRIEDTILIENTIFHEDIHYIASFYPHMDKLGKWLMENADMVKAFAEIRDEVETYYEESKRPQEMLCRIVSLAMTTGTTSELDMVVPYELQNIVRQIENEIGYDRGTEESSRKAQWLAQHTGSEEGSEPSAREHPDGRRSDEETRLTAEERRIINEYFPGAFPEEENDTQPDNTGEFSEGEGDIRFSIRTKPAPKKTGKGYKVFYLKDGKLYPPMVANLGGVDTPVGVWLDAEEGTRAGVSKTGRPQVKQGGKGTQGGSGTLAYRPGWHLGEIPYAIQFNRKDENGDRTLFPADFVWAEVEYANEVDYQDEAMSYGYTAKGKFQHSLAGLPKLPIDGSYRYRTNPNPETDPWIITGAMKVNRLLTPSEVDQMVVDAGREPQKRQEGAVTDEQIEALNKELGLVEEEEEVSFRVTGTPTEDVVAEGVSLSPAQLASLAGDIFAALPEESRKKITDGLNGNILGLQDAILQIPTSLATKEEWNDEDKQMAEVVAEQMTKAVGIEMTRPFSASEALWTLYNAVNKSTDLVSEASRALVRRNLGFDSQTLEMEKDARDGVRFRTVGNASANAQASMYNRGAANVWTRLKEVYVDMHASVEELVKAIEKRSGKVAQGFENILMALNQQSSRGLAAMEEYEQKFLNKMFDEIREIMDKTNFKYEDIVRYVILKHGLERNIKLAQRDAMAHYQEIYDDIIAKIKGMNPAQKRTYLTNAQLRDADAKAELAVLQGVNTSALTPDQLRDHKKALAKAKKEAAEAAEHLVRAQKIATMTEQDALDELDKIFKKIEKGTDSVYKEMRKNDYSGISSMFYDTLGVDRKNYATEEEYQAALMQAKADKYDTLGDIEGAAQMEVTLFENAVNTDNLWKSINKATKETLRQQYEANMISKDQYENLRNMFEFYVPLRGFADNTAEDMYTYYRRPNSTGYTKPILGAEGRKTEAESPFGWIAAMAGSAIASNVKNEAKLALYYFVANRPDNGIATLSKTWFVHTPGDVDANGKKIFRPAYPPFNQDLSTDAAKQAYEDWQEQMRDLQKQGLAYEAGQRLNLGNSVVNISDTNKPEHIVNVKVGGKDYTIVINGNPRAAQAINGDLNIESSAQDYGTVFGPMLRWMSSVNTSYNPEFWITNLMRDVAFTMMAVNIKEDPAYRRKFFKNYAKAFKVIIMVAKNEKGTLGNKYIENMYKDFVKYGGVTGYTQIKDSETWEKEIENYLTSNDPASIRNGKVMRGMKSFFHGAHRFGESLEQVSRFAAFLTAVETGKSINEAINDAKEITVNFNRKGSGKMITLEEAKYLTDKNGQPLNKLEQWAAVGLSSIAPLGRRFIMFFNAAIQGLNATYKLYAENKTRAIGWALGYAAVGMINAVLHAMFDDDDDYLDIPQYERRNSLMIGWNGAYFKWALPQEARAFYALGDLAVESVMGRNPHQNVIGEALKISTEILPVNPSEGWKAFMPSVAVPLVELALNEDYKGAPIYNEQKWLTEEERKRSAKWSKAYSGTGDLYIGIAKVLNAATGGDEHDAGWINLQPEKMEHLVQSAFGGTIRTADKFINSIMAAFDPEEDVTVRQFPFLNRILTINDERYKNVHVNDVYDYYAAEAEHALTLKKKYEKDKDKDSYNKLLKSDEYKWAKIYSRYKKPIKQYQEKIKAAEGTKERMELMKQQDELKRKMIKEISDL